jgi:hypothetical protein
MRRRSANRSISTCTETARIAREREQREPKFRQKALEI